MSERSAAALTEHWNQLKAERAAFERTWQEIAGYMRPLRGEFTPREPGARRNELIFDATPVLAAESFAGGIYGMLTNPATRWFALGFADEELNLYEPAKSWLYETETRILNSFGPERSRFYAVLPSLFADLGCFGTAVFYSEEASGGRIHDCVRPLGECVLAENAAGDVDTVYRRFTMTGRQALESFGAGLSPRMASFADKNRFARIAFLHCVHPNEDAREGALEAGLRPFLSLYVEEETRHVAARGGYYEMPYQTPRWAQAAGETYGRGIGEQVLPDVKMLNRMDESTIVAAQKIADPPLIAADEGVIRNARVHPGGVTYGAIDSAGQQLLRPLYTGADVGLALEMMAQRRTAIKEAFHFSLMQTAGEATMTATEWMGRQEEKLRLLGPNLGRIQSEFLSPLIRRRFGMLLRAGLLPPPPPEAGGAGLSVSYVSPLARAQMAGEAQAVVRLYQSLAAVAAAAPAAFDNIDHDQAAQVLGRGWAVPARIMRGASEVTELRARAGGL